MEEICAAYCICFRSDGHRVFLLPIGANSFGGGFGAPDFGDAKYLIVGSITLISCLIFNVKAHSFYKQLSVLFGLVVGYAAAYFYGMVDLSRISQVSIISVPSILPVPLEFHADAIFSIFLIFLVSATETLGIPVPWQPWVLAGHPPTGKSPAPLQWMASFQACHPFSAACLLLPSART